MRRRGLALSLLTLVACSAVAQQAAQPFPTRLVRLIVPFPAGGPTDALSRAMADQLQTALGQPVVVDNKSGAGGNVGLGEAMRAPRDGYTMALITATTSAVNPTLYPRLPYDPDKDVTPVAVFAKTGYVLVGKSSGPAELRGLIAAIKNKPRAFNGAFSSTVGQVGLEMMKSSFGLDFVSVPYKGDSDVLNALMAGDVDFSFTVTPQLSTLIEAGKMRAIATATPQRSPLVPDVPTFAEAGLPGFFDMSAWYGIAVPTGVPRSIVERLNREISKIVATPEFGQRLKQMGLAAVHTTPEQAADLVRTDRRRWQEPIKASGATVP